MGEQEKKEPIKREVVIYGLTRSLQMLIIYVVSFIGMSFVFTDAVVTNAYQPLIIAALGGVLALTTFAVIYGTMRYFAEQTITYLAANMWYIKEFNGNAEEDSEEADE